MPKRKSNGPRRPLPWLLRQMQRPVYFSRDYPILKNHWGVFRLLPNRMRFAAFFDPDNWIDFRSIRVERAEGHQGRRRHVNYEMISQDPCTCKVKGFVFKDQDLSIRMQPNEIEAGVLVRMARVQGEKPYGYWVDVFGNVYAVFERMHGQTLLLEPKERLGPLVDAARQYGRLFAHGLVHQDTGTKHVFVHNGKARLFDFETLREEPIDRYRESDFRQLMASAIEDGRVRSVEQIQQCLDAFLQSAQIKTPKEEKRWMEIIRNHVRIRLQSLRMDAENKRTFLARAPLLRRMVLLGRVFRQINHWLK